MKRRVGVILAAMLATGCGYNNIQTYDEQAAAAQGQIETQLQRRADLIPNLVSTVKGYAQHEEQLVTAVADARSRLLGAMQSGDPTAMANADAQMTGALGRLLAISENYPQLKADANFRQLQDELTGTENRIAVARTDYNDAARQYNTYIRQFPTALTAKVTGAKPRKYFEVTDPAMRSGPPSVDFSKPATPAP
ncbi:MAG: LemA family protein [Gemmatimonadaceae bacterium]|nr:LemA family protein [Gemmatimonadaceae bacterium]